MFVYFKVGLLDRHRVLNLFEMYYDRAREDIKNAFRNPRECKLAAWIHLAQVATVFVVKVNVQPHQGDNLLHRLERNIWKCKRLSRAASLGAPCSAA